MSKVLEELGAKGGNPANLPDTRSDKITRIPMSVPQSKLAVPEIPGWHCHWFLGNPQRIRQALRAGYQFVQNDEVQVANIGVADDASLSGSSDLGSNVSIPAGANDLDQMGNPQSLYLMKIRQEYWEADQALLADRNEQVARTIRGEALEGDEYIPRDSQKAVSNLFTRKAAPASR